MATLESRYTADEVVKHGQALYEEKIRAEVDRPENLGKLLLIDIETGCWFLGEDRLALADAARMQNPDAVLFGMKVGYPAAAAIGATLRPSPPKK